MRCKQHCKFVQTRPTVTLATSNKVPERKHWGHPQGQHSRELLPEAALFHRALDLIERLQIDKNILKHSNLLPES